MRLRSIKCWSIDLIGITHYQQCSMTPGDTAYIYLTSPIKEIRCRCLIEAVDIPCDIGTDEGYVLDENFCARSYKRYMDLKLQEVYDTPLLSYQLLLMNGLSGPIRSQRRAGDALEQYIRSVTEPIND